MRAPLHGLSGIEVILLLYQG